MRFLCPQCAAIVTCSAAEMGKRTQCPDCLHGVAAPAACFDPGTVIGDFVIHARLGSGGMGTVYRAEQISLQRPAALKVLHSSLAASPTQLGRFLKEARIAAAINHPNLIGVYAVGEEDGVHYLAMEYVRGESVQDVLRRQGKLPLEQAAEIVVQVASGLNEAWKRRSIVHCDVKPENILLPEEGGVKIADLGLAETGGSLPGSGSEIGTFAGSPYYVCPEVILGKALDHRSDLYSLGVTFFEMLTGHLPFEGTELAEVAGQHLYAQPPDPRSFIPDLPAGVVNLVNRLLKKAPDERFQSAAELIQAVRVQVLLRTSPELAVAVSVGQGAADPARWVCPACGRPNAEASLYCQGCGAYGRCPCPLCGEDVPPNVQFCNHCGRNLAEQRQGTVRQAEHMLARMDESLGRGELDVVGRLVHDFRQLDQAVLPELIQAQFADVVTHLGTLFEVQAQEARGNLRIDQLEQAVSLLCTVVGAEKYQWLKDEVDGLKKDLAQAVFQAGSALASNCPSTCQRLLAASVAWQGGSLGARLAELKQKGAEKLAQRTRTLAEARAVAESASPDLDDVLRALCEMTCCRLSPKLMVLAPDEADSQADDELRLQTERLERFAREGVQYWLQTDRWDALATLAEGIHQPDSRTLTGVERFVTSSILAEVQERYRAALDAERARDVHKALHCWNRVLQVPPSLLPRQIRREAVAFPARRSRLISEQRRPLLRATLSAVFFLWCLAFSLAGIDLVMLWFNGEFSLGELRSHIIPLVVQLTAIALFSRLLRTPRLLSADEPLPGRQPPLFVSGLQLLWILSPLSGVISTLCYRAGSLAGADTAAAILGALAVPWMAPALVTLFWLAADLRLGGRRRAPLVMLGMTLSWLVAVGVVYLLWETPPDTPLLQVAAAMYQTIVFLLLQAANYLWYAHHREKTALHPELVASAG